MTYLYETVPAREGDPVRHYEIKQSPAEPALTRHPETGEAIRRVILGGWGLTLTPESGKGGKASGGGCGCGPDGCC